MACPTCGVSRYLHETHLCFWCGLDLTLAWLRLWDLGVNRGWRRRDEPMRMVRTEPVPIVHTRVFDSGWLR